MPPSFIVLPTYNEVMNIEKLMPMLLELPVDLGIVIVDDNSPDGTGDLADRLSEENPGRVFAIHREGKLGLGTAYLRGFEFALSQPETERIISMDADFSHHPRYIPDLIAMNAEKDLVIGSRYVPGGSTPDFPLKRIIISYVANMFAHRLLGLEARDATAGFRCYRREILETIPLEEIISNGYSFLVEILFIIQREGFTVGEIPIIFEDRVRGQSKISREEIKKALYTVLRLFGRRITNT